MCKLSLTVSHTHTLHTHTQVTYTKANLYCILSVVYSVCEDAEVHPAGQSLHQKHPQTVPTPLENGIGKLVFSINHNYVLNTEEHPWLKT